MNSKKQNFCYIFALLFTIFGAFLFLAPIFFAFSGAREYADFAEAEAFFVSFFAQFQIFLIHCAAIVSAFFGFLCSLAAILKEKKLCSGVLSCILSFGVILAYIAGYENIFSFLFQYLQK